MPEAFDPKRPFPNLDFAWIAREQLIIDETYQRMHIRHKHVGNIIRNWTPDHFGALNVAPRDDGFFAVIDGQHRLIALDEMGIQPTTAIPCVVHGTSNEPITFVNLNQRAILDPMEDFRARLEGEDSAAWELKNAVEAAGFSIALQRLSFTTERQEKTLYAIKRLQTLMQRYGSDFVTELLAYMGRIWPTDRDAFTSSILGGMAVFMDVYRDMYDPNELARALQTVGPRTLLREARETSVSGTGGIGYAVARRMRVAYMGPGRRLPDIDRVLRERARAARRQDVPTYQFPKAEDAL